MARVLTPAVLIMAGVPQFLHLSPRERSECVSAPGEGLTAKPMVCTCGVTIPSCFASTSLKGEKRRGVATPAIMRTAGPRRIAGCDGMQRRSPVRRPPPPPTSPWRPVTQKRYSPVRGAKVWAGYANAGLVAFFDSGTLADFRQSVA